MKIQHIDLYIFFKKILQQRVLSAFLSFCKVKKIKYNIGIKILKGSSAYRSPL
jgi:hypothetical protein